MSGALRDRHNIRMSDPKTASNSTSTSHLGMIWQNNDTPVYFCHRLPLICGVGTWPGSSIPILCLVRIIFMQITKPLQLEGMFGVRIWNSFRNSWAFTSMPRVYQSVQQYAKNMLGVSPTLSDSRRSSLEGETGAFNVYSRVFVVNDPRQSLIHRPHFVPIFPFIILSWDFHDGVVRLSVGLFWTLSRGAVIKAMSEKVGLGRFASE